MLNVRSLRPIKTIITLAVLLGLVLAYSLTTYASTDQTKISRDVKSYNEWKRTKVSDLESKIREIREKIAATDPNVLKSLGTQKHKTEAGLNAVLLDQLDQEELNLMNTKDLTISDYFVGYILKQNSLDDAIKSVSGKLTNEDVAALMKAYAEQFSKVQRNDGKTETRFELSR